MSHVDPEVRQLQDEWVESLVQEIEERGGIVERKEVHHDTIASVEIDLALPFARVKNE